MAIPILYPRSLELSSALDNDYLALGFVISTDGQVSFPQSQDLAGRIEKKFDLLLADEMAFFSPTGKAGEIYEIPVSAPGVRCERLIFVGLGKETLSDIRSAGAALGRKMRGSEKSLFSAVVTSHKEIRAHAIAIGLGSFQWNMKTSKQSERRGKLYLSDAHPAEIKRANTIGKAVCWARELIHTPSNIKTTAWLAAQAKKLDKEPNLKVKILAGKDLALFGGLRAVGASSPKPGPRLVEVAYAPRGSKSWPHVVLVGKGITFDTGGISLKRPYDVMIGMKSDMAGAAAVLATMSALPDIRPRVRVTALLMCAENSLSGTAQRPGDVITQYGGTTVEVINTDAEGRLVLADGLAYADAKLNPDYLVDVATLTGAASLGLGRQYAAMYTRNSTLAKKLHAIGESSGDRVWRMPLLDDYSLALKSSVADLNQNAKAAKFSAGSVTAALFLEHFVGKRNWVHLDIAGPGRSDNDVGENPKGGTGFGVRLLIDWIAGLS
jgi:leucyl aminopeptidase